MAQSPASMSSVVRVGVGVFVCRDGKILLGERLNAHGEGTWALPGGHLEVGETPEICGAREVLEETGLVVGPVSEAGFSNDIFHQEGKHYLTLFMKTDCTQGEPQLLEPDKCRQWHWFALDDLPEPLFLPLVNFLHKYPEFSAS